MANSWDLYDESNLTKTMTIWPWPINHDHDHNHEQYHDHDLETHCIGILSISLKVHLRKIQYEFRYEPKLGGKTSPNGECGLRSSIAQRTEALRPSTGYTFAYFHIWIILRLHISTFAHLHICTFSHFNICRFGYFHICWHANSLRLWGSTTIYWIYIRLFSHLHTCTFVHFHILTFADLQTFECERRSSIAQRTATIY